MTATTDTPFQKRLPDLLVPGEEVLWQGHPPRRLFLLSRDDRFLIPFSAIWGLLGFLAFAASFGPQVPTWVGLLMGGFAFMLVIGRFLIDKALRARTSYVLTNRRAMVLCAKRVIEKPLTPGLRIAVEPGRIRFGASRWPERTRLLFVGLINSDGTCSFRGIPDTEEVAAKARAIIKAEA